MDENVGSGKRGEQDKYTISVQYIIFISTCSLLHGGYSMRGVNA
jgi:hypothetical protein